MELASEIFSSLWSVWKEIFKSASEILPKAFKFLLWILCGILILPCVYVSGVFFPMWTEWGESM